MEGVSVDLLALRILISIFGVVGNTTLIVSILRSTRLKSFEVFLLGLAAANLEEMVIVDVYDVLRSSYRMSALACRSLKFLTICGEIGSILFTVLISLFRYQKLRDVQTRANLPVFMDSLRSAAALSVFCAALALVFALPTLLVNLDWTSPGSNSSSPVCPVDFFQCSFSKCPTRNRIYKYSFLLLCNLLPLLIVTLTSAMIVRILVLQQRAVRPTPDPTSDPSAGRARHRRSGLQRSTLAILTAMALFQLNWSVYLILHLVCDPHSFPSWSELEFFITTFYTATSPYAYGIGNNLFNMKRCVR